MSVYFAQVGHYIKVGFSENPERRVANLWKSGTRYGRPADCPLDKPTLLATIPGGLNREAECHNALGDYAVGSEFFVDELGVRMFIAAAVEGHIEHVTRPEGPAYVEVSDRDGMTGPEVAAYMSVLNRIFGRAA